MKIILVIILIAAKTLSAIDPPNNVSVSEVTANTFLLKFNGTADAATYNVRVIAFHLSSDSRYFTMSNTSVKVTKLNENVIYDVVVQSVTAGGSTSNISEIVRVRTTPSKAWVTASKPLIPASITVFLEPVPGATEWRISLQNDLNQTEALLDVTKPYHTFDSLTPNANYSVKTRVTKIGNTVLSETASPFGESVQFTTTQLSLFGRVELLQETYIDELSNKTSDEFLAFASRLEAVLQNEYRKVHQNVTSVKILELENVNLANEVLCHHEIYISDPAIPNVSTFQLTNTTLFNESIATTDVNPGHGYAIYVNNLVGLAIAYDDPTCDKSRDEKNFHFTRGENTSETIVVDFTHAESAKPQSVIAIAFGSSEFLVEPRSINEQIIELKYNSIYSIDQNYLFKYCPPRTSSALYNRHYGARSQHTIPGRNGSIVFSTGPEQIDAASVTYKTTASLRGLILTFIAVHRAAYYNFSIAGISTASVSDLDSSSQVEVTLTDFEPLTKYQIEMTVTVDHPKGSVWNQSTSDPSYFPFYSGRPNSTSFRVVEVYSTHFTVLYATVEYATEYVIEIDNVTTQRNYTSTDTSRYRVEHGIAEDVYNVRVATQNPFGTGEFSLPKTTKFWNFSNINETAMTLTWETEEGDSSYEISLAPAAVNGITSVGRYHIAGINPGTYVDVNVTAISANASRTLLFSDTQITVPGAVVNLTLLYANQSSLHMTWNSVQGASSYYHWLHYVNDSSLVSTGVSLNNAVNLVRLTAGRRYQFIVAASNAAGNGTQTAEDFETDLYQPILSEQADSVDQTGFRVSWIDAKDADYHFVYVANANGSKLTFTSYKSPLNVTGLTAGTIYNISVQAIYEVGNTSSEILQQITVPGSLEPLTLTKRTNQTLSVMWSMAPGAQWYNVSTKELKETTTFLNWTFIDLEPGTIYSVHVTGNNEAGPGITVTEAFETLPNSPPKIYISDVNQTSFKASWDSQMGAVYYYVSINFATGTMVQNAAGTGSVSANNTIVSNLEPGQTYTVYVLTSSNAGNSSTVSSSVLLLPGSPKPLSLIERTNQTLSIMWSMAPGAQWYNVSTEELKETTTFLNWTFIDLEPRTIYSVHVTGNNEAGPGITVTEAFETLPNSPPKIYISDVNQTSFKASWDSQMGAVYYYVSITFATGTVVQNAAGIGSVSANNTIVSNLEPGQPYTVYVFTSSNAGNSSTVSSSVLLLPGSLEPLSLIGRTNQTLSIMWSMAPGAQWYNVSTEELKETTTFLNWTFIDLEPGTIYSVHVTGNNEAGPGVTVTEAFETLPNSPPKIYISDVNQTSFKASWDSQMGAVYYYVSITFANGTVVQNAAGTGSVSANNTIVSNLEPGQTYTVYVLTSSNAGNSSTVSSSVLLLPGSPEPLSLIERTNQTLSIMWSMAPGAQWYNVSTEELKETTTFLNWTFIDLEPGTIYSVHVTGNNAAGPGITVTEAFETLPNSPPKIYISDVNQTSFKASWNSQMGAVYYYVSTTFATGTVVQNAAGTGSVSANNTIVSNLKPGQTYTVYVLTSSNAGNSSTVSSSVLLPPGNPGPLIVTNKTNSSINTEWEDAQGASWYTIVYQGFVFNSTLSNWNFTGLETGTIYSVNVTAHNDAGSSLTINSMIETLPGTPPEIRFSNITSASFQATWDIQKGAVSYYVTVASGGTLYEEATGTGTIYANTTKVGNLLAGSMYEVSVFASSNAGNSGVTSNTVLLVPGPVSNLTVETISENSLDIAWEPSEGTDYYIINVGDISFQVNISRLNIPNLLPGIQYTVHVTSVNTAGASTALNATFETLPASPDVIHIRAVTQYSFLASWEKQNGAINYRTSLSYLDNSTVAGVGGIGITSSNKTNVTSLMPGQRYLFCVVTISNVGNSKSRTVEVLTLPAAPISLMAVSKTTNSVELNWSVVFGADSYNVLVNGRNFTVNGTTFNATNLEAGSKYAAAVHSSNAAGSSEATTRIFQTIPASPTILISNATTNSFVVSWTKSNGAISYNVVLLTKENGTLVTKIVRNQNQTTAYIGNLTVTNTTAFILNVIAVTESGDESEKQNLNVELSTPAPPENLTLVNRTETSLTLTWNVSATENFHEFQVMLNGTMQTTTTNVITFDELESGSLYLASVNIINNIGIRSPLISGYFQTVPSSPNDTISNITGTTFLVFWNEVKGADGYEVQVHPSETENLVGEYLTTNTSVTVTNLTHGTSYNVSVTSVSENERSTDRNIVTTVTLSSSPGNVRVISVSQDSVSLEWTASKGAVRYFLTAQIIDVVRKKRTADSNTLMMEIQAPLTSAHFKNLSSGSDYRITIMAFNPSGVSPGVQIQFQTGALNPKTLLASNVKTDSLQVNWDAQNGATSYWFNITSQSLTYQSTMQIQTIKRTAGNLQPGTSYTVSVTSISRVNSEIPYFENLANIPQISVITVPLPPQNVTLVANNGQVVLQWAASVGAVSYIINIENSVINLTINTEERTFNVSHIVQTNVLYMFAVFAVNAQNRTSASSVISEYIVENITTTISTPLPISQFPWWIILIVVILLAAIGSAIAVISHKKHMLTCMTEKGSYSLEMEEMHQKQGSTGIAILDGIVADNPADD